MNENKILLDTVVVELTPIFVIFFFFYFGIGKSGISEVFVLHDQ